MVATKAVVVAVVMVCAVVGVIVAIMAGNSKSDNSTSNKSGGGGNSQTNAPSSANKKEPSAKSSKGKSSDSVDDALSSGSSSGNSTGSAGGPMSDPSSAKFALTALAIGDWGQTVAGDSCCSRGRKYDERDQHAMDFTAKLLAQAATAASPKPSVIISHGDNFYWAGINGQSDQQTRFEATFEKTYSDPAIINIPWVNVMGNHDYGGASYVCSEGGQSVQCSGADAVIAGVKEKFAMQSTYKSPNNDRWKMKDHYYVHSIVDDATGVSIDIFNLETNDAHVHGADQICCQCYGYSEGDKDKKCNTITRGDKFCAGGDTGIYDACMKVFDDWGQESRDKLVADVKKSKATWKIVNSHYGTYAHYSEEKSKVWQELLNGLGVQLWIYGHTHGEKHDYAPGIHFIENGAGGGIQSESPSGIPAHAKDYAKNIWAGTDNYPYGIFELAASKDWLRTRFITFDKSWVFAETVDGTKAGGMKADHCWMIPRDGKEGQECATS